MALVTILVLKPISILAANENVIRPNSTITKQYIDENGYTVKDIKTDNSSKAQVYVDTNLKIYSFIGYPISEVKRTQTYRTFYAEDSWTCLSNTMKLLAEPDHTLTFLAPVRPYKEVKGMTHEDLLLSDYKSSLNYQEQLVAIDNCYDYNITINNNGTYTVSLVRPDLPIYSSRSEAREDNHFNKEGTYLTTETIEEAENSRISAYSITIVDQVIESSLKEIEDANLNDSMTNQEKASAIFYSMLNKGYTFNKKNSLNRTCTRADHEMWGPALLGTGVCDGLNEYFTFTCEMAGIPMFTTEVTISRLGVATGGVNHMTSVLWTEDGMIPYDFSDACCLYNGPDSIEATEDMKKLLVLYSCIGEGYGWHVDDDLVYPANDELHAIQYATE